MQCTHGRWFSTPKKNAGRLSHREEKTIILVETKGSPPSTTMTYSHHCGCSCGSRSMLLSHVQNENSQSHDLETIL